VSVPGAFTPTCQEQHIVSYIENLETLKGKGVDQIIVIAYNDWWVMAAWAKANGIKDDSIVSDYRRNSSSQEPVPRPGPREQRADGIA
jgi:peroxiredoxin